MVFGLMRTALTVWFTIYRLSAMLEDQRLPGSADPAAIGGRQTGELATQGLQDEGGSRRIGIARSPGHDRAART
jgi:hypothetical protein